MAANALNEPIPSNEPATNASATVPQATHTEGSATNTAGPMWSTQVHPSGADPGVGMAEGTGLPALASLLQELQADRLARQAEATRSEQRLQRLEEWLMKSVSMERTGENSGGVPRVPATTPRIVPEVPRSPQEFPGVPGAVPRHLEGPYTSILQPYTLSTLGRALLC